MSSALKIEHDSIPSTVETRRMIAELKEDLLHLECGGKCLNEHGCTNGVVLHADEGLRENEHVVPQARLEIVLHLGEVEVRSMPALDELVRIVVEVNSKIK